VGEGSLMIKKIRSILFVSFKRTHPGNCDQAEFTSNGVLVHEYNVHKWNAPGP